LLRADTALHAIEQFFGDRLLKLANLIDNPRVLRKPIEHNILSRPVRCLDLKN
jgi:hypothetical protein